MLALRRRWAGLSILNKAIVLSCTFVIPILLVVGLLLNDFYAYRKESDRILSEYVLCTDYMDAVENEMSLLGEMTFAAPGSVELEDYADAVQNTSLVWERLRTTASAGGRDGEVLRQVIGRMMKSYRARQKIFLTGLRGGTFDADEYEQLRAQGEYLTQYADRLMDDFLMEGRDSYLNLGKRSSSQNIVFTIAAALGSVLFAAAMLYYARSLLLPVQQMSRGARRVAEGEYDMGDFHYARTDEIGMLADSFNHLKHQVARTIHALEGEAQLEKSLRHQESEAARLRQLIEQSRFAQLQSQINRLGLQEDFVLLGAKTNPYPYYRQCDLYVHATRFEGKSIAIQEAQTLGCTILVSDSSGNREQVIQGEDGMMCSLTPEAVSRNIEELLKNPQKCRELGQKAAVKLSSEDKDVLKLFQI